MAYAVYTLFAALCFGLTAASAVPRYANPSDDLVKLYELIDGRLALMNDVAAWKWQHEAPVTDTERERLMLNTMTEYAAQLGLAAEPTRQFFQQQIDWASAIQSQRFAVWKAQGLVPGIAPEQPVRAGKSLDLAGEIRPKLDAIGHEQLRLIYLLAAHLSQLPDDQRTEAALTRIAAKLRPRETNSEAALRANLRARLSAFNVPSAGQLKAIRTSGILRVATTGDYQPFSNAQNDELQGFDIQLALALAKHLEVEPRFVRTSWPTLMKDLSDQQFDLALGGVSVTPERARAGQFSVPYHSDGKTPIALCSERSRYVTLMDIDQPTTRVIVNPGGTNEQFTRSHLSHASIQLHADNRSIFAELIAGRADVMITDATEVAWQSRLHPELCATTEQRFTHSEKALLLPLRSDAVAETNAWLRQWSAAHSVAEWMRQSTANQ